MILLFFIVAVLVACLNMTARKRQTILVSTSIFLLVQLLVFAYTCMHKNGTELHFFTYDALGILFFGLLNVLGIASFIHSIFYLNTESIKELSFYQTGFVLLSASIVGSYFANNIMVSWILLEVTTIAAAFLIYHRRTPKALEATWKYIFVCSTGVALAYFGILFLSISMRGVHDADMSYTNLSQVVNSVNPIYLKLAFLFIVVGYSSKLEVFPLYTIGIDANNAAPTPASMFISTAMVNMGFISIFRVYVLLSSSPIFHWMQNVLIICGLISVLIAIIYMQRVHNLKRLLAYSTVENMGIVAVALGIGGTGFYIAVLHVVIHSLLKGAAFAQLSQVGKIYGTYNVFKTGGYLNINPAGAITIILAVIGITATPPSGLFFTELLLFKELSCGRHYIILVVLAIMLCFVIYSLYSRFLYLCYKPLKENHIIFPKQINPYLTAIQLLLIVAGFAICIYQPQWLKLLLHEVVEVFI